MKHLYIALAIVSTLLFGGVAVYAQTAISGNALCGSSTTTECNFGHLKQLVKGLMFFVIGIGLPLLVAVIGYRFVMAWFYAAQGQTGAYKDAAKKAGQSILGLLILVALFGGVLIVLLKYLGASGDVIKLLELIKTAFIPTVYAQDTLPSPIGDTNLYDFMLKIISLVMRFFVYPALIVIWVSTGFSFVLAQGKPDALTKAKKLLIWATVSTFVVVMIQAFLVASKGTVEQILPGSTSGTQVSASNNAASCTASGGTLASDGTTCNASASRAGSAAADYCNGKPTGTLCTLSGGASGTGICKRDTVVGCFRPSQGEECISPSGKIGTIDSSGNCFTRTSGVDAGGSCRIKEECLSDICFNSVCYNVGDQCTKTGGTYGRITTARDCQ